MSWNTRSLQVKGLQRLLQHIRQKHVHRETEAIAKLETEVKLFDLKEFQRRSDFFSKFYAQSAIDASSKKDSIRLTPASLLYTAKQRDYLLRSAQYLQRELPVRISHRIEAFRNLPFIIGCNSNILAIHELYLRAFQIITELKPVETFEDEIAFTDTIKKLLTDHSQVISMLAKGFSETKRHLKDANVMRNFLDRTLTSRLGIRLLCEHHIALHEDNPYHIGTIKMDFNLCHLIEKTADHVKDLADVLYGFSPTVKIVGDTSVCFPYISQPIEYIVMELLKNAIKATCEASIERPAAVNPITVLIAMNDEEFMLRFSDRGVGVPLEIIDKIWEYQFTTNSDDACAKKDTNIFSSMMKDRQGDSLCGYGYGLPTSRAYATYLGGSLTMQSMIGMGTDVYLRLKQISNDTNPFRI